MAGLSVGSALSAGAQTASPRPRIVATLAPSMHSLLEGQSLADIPGFASMISVSNFSSPVGSVLAADVTLLGSVLSAQTALAEGDLAGFSVTVTDTENNTRVFTAAPITVEYKVRVTVTASNEADIDVNPLVPDAEALEITLSGTAHDGTYTPTAGDLRDGPYPFSGTVSISGTGGAGNDLTLDTGFWTTPTGDLTLAVEWLRDGVAIGGETGATYTQIVADEETTITALVTGGDGVNTPVATVSNGIAVPSATIISDFNTGIVGVQNDTDPVNQYFVANRAVWSGYITGTDAYITIGANSTNTTSTILVVSVDGGSAVNKVWGTVGAEIPLFEGLSDAEHFVTVRAGPPFGPNVFVRKNEETLRVVGAAPSYRNANFAFTAGAAGVKAATAVTGSGFSSFDPKDQLVISPMLVIEGSVDTVYVGQKDQSRPVVVFFRDGAGNVTTTEVATPQFGGAVPVPAGTVRVGAMCGLSSPNTFFGIGSDKVATIPDLPRLYHFGHSIVAGTGVGLVPGRVDMARTAMRNGYIYGSAGVPGATIGDMLTSLNGKLPSMPVTAGDVMILDIGRNDGGDTFTAQEVADYNAAIDACVAKGFTKILCLGIAPLGIDWPDANASIAGIVSAQNTAGNANVYFVDRSAYTVAAGITLSDGTHPDAAGYIKMDELNATFIDPHL